MDLIKSHTNEEIMTKNTISGLKQVIYMAILQQITSKHYVWALKKCDNIAKSIKEGEKDQFVK